MADDAPLPELVFADAVRRPGWESLRTLTTARVALGRAGAGLPTDAHLAFQLAHARARDAVYSTLDLNNLLNDLRPLSVGGEPLALQSAAGNRSTYLQRPDLGRHLSPASEETLRQATKKRTPWDVAFVIADGLSATAANRHAVAVLDAVLPLLRQTGNWNIAPLVLVEQGRVAIGDPIARALGAEIVVVLLGERPGLSAPDSLGTYLTHRPKPETTDADRNCLSNIRPDGMSYADAATKLCFLLTEARRRGLSGVALKDEASEPLLTPTPG